MRIALLSPLWGATTVRVYLLSNTTHQLVNGSDGGALFAESDWLFIPPGNDCAKGYEFAHPIATGPGTMQLQNLAIALDVEGGVTEAVYTSADGELKKFWLDGGWYAVSSTGTPGNGIQSLAVDQSFIYWTGANQVMKASK